MDDGGISQDQRFRRSRFESKHDGLRMTSLWPMLVESEVTDRRHVWLSEFWLRRGRSFRKEMVVHTVFPFRDHEKEDPEEIHCF